MTRNNAGRGEFCSPATNEILAITTGAHSAPVLLDDYAALLPLAADSDFALRLRALLALGRLGRGEPFIPLVKMLKRENANHWRLAILDTLLALPYEDKITPLTPLLAEDQPGDADAYFLGGLVWFFGQQGPAAIAPLIEHVLNKPARARRLKDSLLAEAVFLAAGGEEQILCRWAESSPPFYRFCSNRVWPRDLRPRFSLYPNPDYLLQKARESGLSHSQFRSLHFWPRRKAGRPAPPD